MQVKTYSFDERHFLEDIKGFLQIKSVNGDAGDVSASTPLGKNINEALEFILNIGRNFGFRAKNIDGYCGWIEMGEGNRMVGIIAHVDTVPAEPEGWLAPPFSGTVIDENLYGRGACDDKGPALAALYAMKAVADSGCTLDHRVRLILGGDEEGGDWRCMERYKKSEELPEYAFTPDAEFPVTYAEKGILHARIFRELDFDTPTLLLKCGKAYNVVPAFARASFNGEEYTAHGVSAHAMEPEKGDNAILKLCFEMRSKGFSHPFLSLAEVCNTEKLGIDFSDLPSGNLTINPSIARVDEKTASLCCDIRIPVTLTSEKVLEAIKLHVAPLGFSVENESYNEPLYVEVNSPLVATLQDVYCSCTGRNDAPASTGGGTYARAFSNAVAFGALFPDEEVTYHKINEHWPLKSIRSCFQILANAIAVL